MKQLTLGATRIDRIVELEGLGYEPTFFFPDATLEGFAAERDWLVPHFWDAKEDTYIRSIQSFVVRTGHHNVLIDACVGNQKKRPSTPAWDGLQSNWMGQLSALGLRPEDIDYVLCTHLHADHVGWNTKLVDGRWVPTFPNAKYVIHKKEFDHWQDGDDGVDGPGSADGCYQDSVLPVVEAGLAELVDNDFAIGDNFTLDPTPGHSPGHVSFNISAGGARAVIAGDAVHHPIQIAYPEWNSRFCMDADQSRATRKKFVERHADTDTLILAAHFPAPTVGRIVGNGARCKFQV
ncbi:MAG: MBL fold metallo-hydrolase [Rhodospirillales bacterium]|nr:MBL fold metallo-hydrolase [Rhodospirillales bacterium]